MAVIVLRRNLTRPLTATEGDANIENLNVQGEATAAAAAALLAQMSGKVNTVDLTALLVGKANAAHGHVVDDITGLQAALNTKVNLSVVGAPSGVASLDSTGKIPESQIPSLSIADFLGEVANEAAMLALTGQPGDWCIRTDRGTTFLVRQEPSDNVNSWRELAYPTAPVTSVAGKVGSIILNRGDVGLGNVDNTSDASKPISTAAAAALAGKADSVHTHELDAVNGLVSALAGKANQAHSHSIAQITNLQTELNNKAPVAHAHVFADIAGLSALVATLLTQTQADARYVLQGGGGSSQIVTAGDSGTGVEDTSITGNVLTNDSTSVGTLSVTQFTVTGVVGVFQPGQQANIPGIGTFNLAADGAFTFAPAANWSGTVPTISYQVTNGSELRLAPLNLVVSPANDAPTVLSDSTLTALNSAVIIDLLANDTDIEGSTLSIATINGVVPTVGVTLNLTNGQVVLNANGTVTVTPNTDFEGDITFPYTVTDGTATSTGTVVVQVGIDNVPMFSPAARLIPGDPRDDALANFALTAMNRVGDAWGNGTNVTTSSYTVGSGRVDLAAIEPWLYDRASTFYKIFLRTRNNDYLTHAQFLCETYMAGVTIDGNNRASFNIGGGSSAGPGDIKYLYALPAYWYEKETGSQAYRARAVAIYNQSLVYQPNTYSSGQGLWTERNVAAGITNCLALYWITGNTTYLTAAEAYGAMILGMSAASGAPLHPHSQHEGSGISTPITSMWMGAFLVEAMLQLYRTNGNEALVTWIARYADFCVANGFYTATGSAGQMANGQSIDGLQLPYYLVGVTTSYSEGGYEADMEHAYDVSNMLQKGIWAKQRLSESTTAMQAIVNSLNEVAFRVFTHWTRATNGLPRYRVNPPRKFNWWHTNNYSRVFHTFQLDAPPVAPGLTTAPSIAGSTDVGSTLTATPGVYTGSPAPTVTRVWLRDGTPIPGATGLTYVTQQIDVGNALTYRETATNPGGSVEATASQSIVPVQVGAPAITVQPTGQAADPTETATFAVTATGAATLLYQWTLNGSDISGATSASYTTPVLSAPDNGNVYRVRVTNGVGSVLSNAAGLSVTQPAAAQPALRLAGSTQGLIETGLDGLGVAGHGDFTMGMLVRFNAAFQGNDQFLTAGHSGNGRAVQLQSNNVFDNYDVVIGDTQTGVSAAFGTDIPLNTWIFLALSANSTDRGLTAIWTADGGATYQTITKANGVEGSVIIQQILVNGGGAGNGHASMDVQFIRAINDERTAAQMAAMATSNDPTGHFLWWTVAADGSITDSTGNNRVPTIVGAPSVVTDGPVIGGIGGGGATSPTITAHPQAATVGEGFTASFGVTATGAGTLTYQWTKNGVDVSGGTGGTTASYTTPALTNGDNGAVYRCEVTNAGGTTTTNGAVVTVQALAPAPLASAAPRILLNNSGVLTGLQEQLASNVTAATRFRDMVLGEIATPGSRYAFSAYFSALMYRITGTASYGTFAKNKVMTFLASEEALINAGQRAVIAGDSYLEVGPRLGDMLLTMDWCRDFFTQGERDRILAYTTQTIYNVWNPNTAAWGGVTYTWSGWSINNPANNYYYSFLEATLFAGLAFYGDSPALAQSWLNIFYTQKITNQLDPYFDTNLGGGGSQEGTGYGTAMRGLFRLYYFFEKSTGVNIADLNTHARRSAYWTVHNIAPSGAFLAPVGDHARDSTAALYDYHRDYLLSILMLYPTDEGARVAKQAVADSGITQMAQSMNYWSDYMWNQPTINPLPKTTLRTAFYDQFTGHFISRSDWSSTATYVHQIAGPYTESHAHRDQGSFMLWKGGWLFDDQNIRGASGIEQDETNHNLVRFTNAGATVTQSEGAAETVMLALADNTNFSYSLANTLPPYNGQAQVVKSQRELLFLKPGCVVVFDRAVSNSAGIDRRFMLNMSAAPTISGDLLTLVKGANRADVHRIAPAAVTWTTNSVAGGGVRAEAIHASGTESLFLHVIGVNNDVTSVAVNNAAGETGVTITFANGRVAIVRFSDAGTGGTLDYRVTAGGTVIFNGALPTTVTAIPLLA